MRSNQQAYKIATIYSKWINECSTTHSAHTVKSYTTTMTSFLNFLEEIKMVKSSEFCVGEAFDRNIVQDWLSWLAETRNCSSQTCNVRLANLRSFLKYLATVDCKYRSVYMSSMEVKYRKTIKKKVVGLSKAAVKAILSTPDTNNPTGYRDAILLSFLYATGVRIEELVSVKIHDLNLDIEYPYVIVIGKGSKIRSISIPSKLNKMLKKYIQLFHGANAQGNDYLFFSKIKGQDTPLTKMAIVKRIKYYATIANQKCSEVPLTLHAHQFRHARATHWLDDGLNIAQVSTLLGHANIATTMVYLDITIETKSCAVQSRMNEEIKDCKPKWSKSDVKSLLSIFGL